MRGIAGACPRSAPCQRAVFLGAWLPAVSPVPITFREWMYSRRAISPSFLVAGGRSTPCVSSSTGRETPPPLLTVRREVLRRTQSMHSAASPVRNHPYATASHDTDDYENENKIKTDKKSLHIEAQSSLELYHSQYVGTYTEPVSTPTLRPGPPDSPPGSSAQPLRRDPQSQPSC